MKRHHLLAILLLFIAGHAVHAQGYGPGNFPNPPAGTIGNNPAPAGQKLAVPDYIKPGFQMIQMSMSSTEGEGEGKPGSAGMGFAEHTIVAVTKDKVFVTVTNYLTPNGMPIDNQGNLDPDTDPQALLIGSSSYAITSNDVQGGNALWMPVNELKAWQTGNGIEVQTYPWPYQGKQVNTKSIIVKGNDFINSMTFHEANGMKIVERSGTGAMRRNATGNDPFARKIQSQSMLLDTKQLDSPLIGKAWPAWAKTVKKMKYKGTYSMPVPGSEIPPMQMAMAISFGERGADYVVCKSSLTTQGGGMPQTNQVVQGPGTMLGYWVHPEVLANLDEGTIEQNKIMRTKLTYQVQEGNLGRLGVFVKTNESKSFYTVSGYNLQNGALTYVSLFTADPDTTIEFTLDGIESE